MDSFAAAGNERLFYYQFAWNQEPRPVRHVYGAVHAMDLPFVFANFGRSIYSFAFSRANRPGRMALSDQMIGSIRAFVRTGSPQQPGARRAVGPVATQHGLRRRRQARRHPPRQCARPEHGQPGQDEQSVAEGVAARDRSTRDPGLQTSPKSGEQVPTGADPRDEVPDRRDRHGAVPGAGLRERHRGGRRRRLAGVTPHGVPPLRRQGRAGVPRPLAATRARAAAPGRRRP